MKDNQSKILGKYCKAFSFEMYNRYDGWQDHVKRETGSVSEFQNDTVLFLHQNYIVTEGIDFSEKVVFDHITPDWKTFCEDDLGFIVPDFIIDDMSKDL